MRAFTTTFDYTNNMIELGINPEAAEYVSVHTVLTDSERLGIAAISIVGFLILATVAYYCYKKWKRDNYKLVEQNDPVSNYDNVMEGDNKKEGADTLINDDKESDVEF